MGGCLINMRRSAQHVSEISSEIVSPLYKRTNRVPKLAVPFGPDPPVGEGPHLVQPPCVPSFRNKLAVSEDRVVGYAVYKGGLGKGSAQHHCVVFEKIAFSENALTRPEAAPEKPQKPKNSIPQKTNSCELCVWKMVPGKGVGSLGTETRNQRKKIGRRTDPRERRGSKRELEGTTIC